MSASSSQIALALIACGGSALALCARNPRLRYLAMGIALAAAVGLIADQVWNEPRFADIRGRPALIGAALVFGGIALGATASVFVRAPAAFAIAAVIVLPLRVPIQVGSDTNYLLVPLYGVIAGGFLRGAWHLVRGRAEELQTRSAPRGDEPWAVRGLCLALAASLLVYGLGVAWTADPDNATRTIAFFLTPFASLFVLLRDLRWYRKLLIRCLLAFAAITFVFAVVALYQHHTRDLIFNKDLKDANQLHIYFRVNSLFKDPNVLGRYLAVALVAAGAYLAYARRAWQLVVGGVFCGVLLLALTFSFSITSFGALVAGLGMLCWMLYGRRGLAGVAGLVVLGAVVVAFLGGPASGSGSPSDRLEGRANLVRGGLDMFKSHPLDGVGSGGFATSFRKEIAKVKRPVSHSEPITVAAEAGILGLIPYIALLILAALVLVRPWPAGQPMRAAIAACFVAMFVHTLGYAGFLIDPATWALLALALAARSVEMVRAPQPDG